MKIAEVRTRCECQGWLAAHLDEAGLVVSGSAWKGRGAPENAPATALGAGRAQFQIGWLCPRCGRNTLRSFDRGGLVYKELLLSPAATAAA